MDCELSVLLIGIIFTMGMNNSSRWRCRQLNDNICFVSIRFIVVQRFEGGMHSKGGQVCRNGVRDVPWMPLRTRFSRWTHEQWPHSRRFGLVTSLCQSTDEYFSIVVLVSYSITPRKPHNFTSRGVSHLSEIRIGLIWNLLWKINYHFCFAINIH